MAEFNKQKADLNKDGSLSDYELKRGKAVAAAMPMLNTVDGYKHLKAKAQKRMGHQMNFGSKQVNTPSAFSNYDYGTLMSSLPQVEYVNPAGQESISMQESGLVENVQSVTDPLNVQYTSKYNSPKEVQISNPAEKKITGVITNKAERVGGKIQRLERRKALQEFKGKQRLDKGFTLGANQKRDRIANIERRQNRLRKRLK